jgi:hypothetical protein
LFCDGAASADVLLVEGESHRRGEARSRHKKAAAWVTVQSISIAYEL